MKKNMRIIIDFIMFILFIILMGYHITGNMTHEVIGVITFTFFLLHHIVNMKWYKTIWKGKYSFYRTFQIIINTLLFITMIGIIVSSIMISSHVFSFLNFKTTMFGRNLHMLSTSWGFLLMAIHLGLHLNVMLTKMNKKMKSSTFEYVYYFVMILFIMFGLYTFIETELWNDLFLLQQFKFFDYDQNPYLFYLGQFAIACMVSFLTYFLFFVIRNTFIDKQNIKGNRGSDKFE